VGIPGSSRPHPLTSCALHPPFPTPVNIHCWVPSVRLARRSAPLRSGLSAQSPPSGRAQAKGWSRHCFARFIDVKAHASICVAACAVMRDQGPAQAGYRLRPASAAMGSGCVALFFVLLFFF